MSDVVVVDDDADLAEAVADILESEGHAVRIARDGEHGLRLLAERLPELIVLDIEMPVLSGPEMAKRLIVEDAGRERIPIILLSGAATLFQIAVLVGTPYALAKPCEVDTLLDVIRHALTERLAPHPAHAFLEQRA
jgi:DNA-binding response OmpR family regulator